MRIAIYHNLPSGGAKRTLFEQVIRLANKHTIDVYSLSCANHQFGDIRPLARSNKIFPFSPSPLFSSPWGRINQLIRRYDLARLESVMKEVAGQIDAGGYDIIYVQPCQFTNSPSILYYLKSPTVFYAHETLRLLYDPVIRSDRNRGKPVQWLRHQGLDAVDPLPQIYRGALAKTDLRNARSCDLVLVNSSYSQQRYVQVYARTPEICYHGVDTELFCSTGETKLPQVVSVGALRSNKGFDFLIQSLGLIPADIRPFLKIISNANNPTLSSELKNLAATQKVELEICTLIGDDELVRTYNQSSLTVYAPHYEPFGLVPLESMACGTPVVGVAEGGVKETIKDQATGLLVERDPTKFSRAVSSLLEDEERRKQMGRESRKYVLENWGWDHAVRRLESYLVDTAAKVRTIVPN